MQSAAWVKKEKYMYYLFFPGVIFLASVLRFYKLGSESFWLDEATTAQYATQWTIPELITHLFSTSPHPPLYFIINDIWARYFGTSELVLRTLPALFGILAVVSIFYTGRELFNTRAGLYAAFILAIAPFHIEYSQEARMYSLLTFLTIVSIYTFWKFLNTTTRKWSIIYAFTAILLAYTHVYGLFVIASEVVYAVWFFREDTKKYKNLFLPVLLIAVGSAPYTIITLKKAVSPSGRISWITPPTMDECMFILYKILALNDFISFAVILLGIGFLLLSFFLIIHYDEKVMEVSAGIEFSVILFVFTFILPIIISYTITPIFVARYTLPSTIGIYLIIAAFIEHVPRDYLDVGFLLIFLVLSATTMIPYYQYDTKPQWDEASHYLEQNTDETDLIVVTDFHAQRPLNYYYTGDATVVPVDKLSKDRFKKISQEHGSTIWVVFSYTSDQEQKDIHDKMVEGGCIEKETQAYQGLSLHRFEHYV